ncbi:MAG: hypothetical protein K6A43_01900 [Treponema sp.]|nr:hypothetical protein [Treponema sp.]
MKKIGWLFTLVLFSLGLTACSGLYEAGTAEDKAYVSFSVVQIARTINADNFVEDDITEIKLTAKDSSGDGTYYSWVSEKNQSAVQKMEEDSLVFAPGAYTFELELYAATNLSQKHLVQTAEKSVELVSGKNVVDFECKWASDGDLELTFTWEDDGETPEFSSIDGIKAGLFTFESKGQEPVEGYELVDLEIVSAKTTKSAVFTGESIPAGNYFVKYYVYRNDDVLPLMNGACMELVKINGYKTTQIIPIEIDSINIYQVTYNICDSEGNVISTLTGNYGDSVDFTKVDFPDTSISGWKITAQTFDGEAKELGSIEETDLSKSDYTVFKAYQTVNFIALDTPPVTVSVAITYYYKDAAGNTVLESENETVNVTYAADSTEDEIKELLTNSVQEKIDEHKIPDGFEYKATNEDFEKYEVSVFYEQLPVTTFFSITILEQASDEVSATIALEYDGNKKFTAKKGFTTYKWFLDDELVKTSSTNEFVITDIDSMSAGVHFMMLEVIDSDGESYSDKLSFRLER